MSAAESELRMYQKQIDEMEAIDDHAHALKTALERSSMGGISAMEDVIETIKARLNSLYAMKGGTERQLKRDLQRA
jgi:hypothetical protein